MIAVIIVGAGLIVEIGAMLSAPLGYQDETGFHTGAKKSPQLLGSVKP
jgi:hypothetical protein